MQRSGCCSNIHQHPSLACNTLLNARNYPVDSESDYELQLGLAIAELRLTKTGGKVNPNAVYKRENLA